MKKQTLTEAAVRRVLARVDDPDMGFNIVDLGLIYTVRIRSRSIGITMTFTSIGCPRAPEILYNIECELRRAFPEYRSTIDVVWEPPWRKEMLSEKGKAHLAAYR